MTFKVNFPPDLQKKTKKPKKLQRFQHHKPHIHLILAIYLFQNIWFVTFGLEIAKTCTDSEILTFVVYRQFHCDKSHWTSIDHLNRNITHFVHIWGNALLGARGGNDFLTLNCHLLTADKPDHCLSVPRPRLPFPGTSHPWLSLIPVSSPTHPLLVPGTSPFGSLPRCPWLTADKPDPCLSSPPQN